MKKRWIVGLLLISMLLVQIVPVTAVDDSRDGAVVYSVSGDLSLAKPSPQELVDKVNQIVSASSVFDEEPSTSAPYALGRLSDSYRESTRSAINYYRFAAGLAEVETREDLNTSAQYGAVLLGAVDMLTHTPSQPEDMDPEFYEAGYTATSRSNLSCSYGYSLNDTGILAVSGQITDNSSARNCKTMGHRRWLLNPQLKYVGVGMAQSENWNYVDIRVFDRSASMPDFDFISWPASGYCLSSTFTSNTPWSVTLNLEKFETPDEASVSVVMTRMEDHATEVLNADTGSAGASATSDAYFVVENSGYGIRNCIIFRPSSAFVTSSGSYHVEITGLTTKTGEAAKLSYDVTMFDPDETEPDPDPDPDPEPEVDPCLSFEDVDRTSWYHGAVDYALVRGITNGTTETTFSPDSD